jgi:hypothetical protein
VSAEQTIDAGAVVFTAIDDALHRFGGRTLVSGSEVVDLLLDLRIAIEAETRVGALLASAPS